MSEVKVRTARVWAESPRMPRSANQCRILLLEDDPFARRALATLLSLQGYQVISAASAKEALELLGRSGNFTHVLIDLMLGEGEGEGTAVLSRLREIRYPARIAVTSATTDSALLSRAM